MKVACVESDGDCMAGAFIEASARGVAFADDEDVVGGSDEVMAGFDFATR